MFKLLDSYSKKKHSDDILGLLGDMCFLYDKSTADPAIWEDWIEITNNQKTLTKQEAFDSMIRFLEIYRDLTSSKDIKILINKLQTAKNCNDTQIPIVKQWNTHLKEVLKEPEDSREYLQFT